MVAPLGYTKDLSDQQPLELSWTMVSSLTSRLADPNYVNHVAHFIDVAMVPKEHIFVGHKDHGFAWSRDNGKAEDMGSMAPKVTVSRNSKRKMKLAPSRKKMTFGSLKKFSKKMIERLVEEQLIADSIKNIVLDNKLLYDNDFYVVELTNQHVSSTMCGTYVPHRLGYNGNATRTELHITPRSRPLNAENVGFLKQKFPNVGVLKYTTFPIHLYHIVW